MNVDIRVPATEIQNDVTTFLLYCNNIEKTFDVVKLAAEYGMSCVNARLLSFYINGR